jgi:hypothetical protein
VTIYVRSLESGSVLHYRFVGHIAATDLEYAAATEQPYFDALKAGQCVNIVADLSELESIAPELFARLPQMRIFGDRRVCELVIAGANPYLRALVISLGLVTAQRSLTFRNSFDEGLRSMGLPSNGKDGKNGHQESGKRV